jgi:hypothetical protein
MSSRRVKCILYEEQGVGHILRLIQWTTRMPDSRALHSRARTRRVQRGIGRHQLPVRSNLTYRDALLDRLFRC